MSYSPVTAENFSGLNLTDDPGTVGWGGAIDLLNVDLDRRGRVRARDGYAVFGTKAAAAFDHLFPFVVGTTPYFLAWNGAAGVQAFNGTTGATAGSASGATGTVDTRSTLRSAAVAVTPSGTSVYVAAADNGLQALNADATTWSNVAAGTIAASWNHPYRVGFTPWDQRLVLACYDGTSTGRTIRLRFSDAGAYTTFGANNYVDLVPGYWGSQSIEEIVSWRDLMFVFKRDTFFVFYGTSTDSSGNPIFNYRTVQGYGGTLAVAGRTGVYFANNRGIYFTTGGSPTRISGPVDPLLEGFAGVNSFFTSYDVADGAVIINSLAVGRDERLYVVLSTGGTLVYDPVAGTWTYWEFANTALHICPHLQAGTNSDSPDDSILFVSGNTNVYNKQLVTTIAGTATDNGTAITSRYRSGFSDLGSPDRKRVPMWRLTGSGTPTLKLSTDFGSLETGATVTLGTSPAVDEGTRKYAVVGRNVSWQVSGTSAWSLNSVVAEYADKKAPGE